MSNGTYEQRDLILSSANLLSALQVCLSEAKAEVRGPAGSCILELVSKNPRRKKSITEAGIVSTLKRLCEWSDYGGTSGSQTMQLLSVRIREELEEGVLEGIREVVVLVVVGLLIGERVGRCDIDEDRVVVQRARVGLDWLEHGEGYV